jgi:hypothetical protein
VAAQGCQDEHPIARRPKLCAPGDRGRTPLWWIKMVFHQGSHRASLQTPRAGRRRSGGLAVYRTADASASRDAEVRGSVRTPASRAPLDFPSARLRIKPRTQTRREIAGGWLSLPRRGRVDAAKRRPGGVLRRDRPHPSARCARSHPPRFAGGIKNPARGNPAAYGPPACPRTAPRDRSAAATRARSSCARA